MPNLHAGQVRCPRLTPIRAGKPGPLRTPTRIAPTDASLKPQLSCFFDTAGRENLRFVTPTDERFLPQPPSKLCGGARLQSHNGYLKCVKTAGEATYRLEERRWPAQTRPLYPADLDDA